MVERDPASVEVAATAFRGCDYTFMVKVVDDSFVISFLYSSGGDIITGVPDAVNEGELSEFLGTDIWESPGLSVGKLLLRVLRTLSVTGTPDEDIETGVRRAVLFHFRF